MFFLNMRLFPKADFYPADCEDTRQGGGISIGRSYRFVRMGYSIPSVTQLPLAAASISSSCRLSATPPAAEKPPRRLPAATTRWQGTSNGKRFFAITVPTLRAPRGEPALRARVP